jgi:hypothetical protein
MTRLSAARVASLIASLAGAGLLGATAGLHFHLWTIGYRTIPTIGPLFLLNGIAASILVIALLATTGWLHRAVALAGAGLEAGTLAGLWLATAHGLFGFIESSKTPFYWESVAVEAAGALLLLGIAVAGPRPVISQLRRTRRQQPSSAGVSRVVAGK